MAAGKHGSSEVTITFDDSGGSPVAITNGVISMSGAKIESKQQMTMAYGDAWEESTPTGIRSVPPITLGGFFDDTASTGMHVVMRVVDADVSTTSGFTRTLTIVFSPQSGSTFAGETRLASYEVLGKNGNLTEFEAVVQPTGTWAWS